MENPKIKYNFVLKKSHLNKMNFIFYGKQIYMDQVEEQNKQKDQFVYLNLQYRAHLIQTADIGEVEFQQHLPLAVESDRVPFFCFVKFHFFFFDFSYFFFGK